MGSKCCKPEDKIYSDVVRINEQQKHINNISTIPSRSLLPRTEETPVMEVVPEFLKPLGEFTFKVNGRGKLSVNIKSTSEYKVTWFRNGKKLDPSSDPRYHYTVESNVHSFNLLQVHVEDEGKWTCVAENVIGKQASHGLVRLMIPRAYKPPEFVEPLRAILTDAGTVSLECKVTGVPTPLLQWFKDGESIKPGDVFALKQADPTSLGSYTCQATNCMGTTVSCSHVHVTSSRPVITDGLVDHKARIGEAHVLTVGVRNPVGKVTWFNKGVEVKEDHRVGMVQNDFSVELVLNPLMLCDEGEWKCSVNGVETNCFVSVVAPKNYRKPRFLQDLKAVLTEEGLVTFECKVVGYPTPELKWFKDGVELKPGDVYQLCGSNSLGLYTCIASNCMGVSESTAELTFDDIQFQLSEEERGKLIEHLSSVNRPPQFVRGLKSTTILVGSKLDITVELNCKATLEWYFDNQLITPGGEFTISGNSLIAETLNIGKEGEYKCVAKNEYGTSFSCCRISLNVPSNYKKPRFLEGLRAVLHEGIVNLECKVIGVPQPTLKWFKDGIELKAGDIHKIVSSGGNCCLGTYTCQARNCMGACESSASLLGFEENKKQEDILEKLARDPSLSTILEERSSQMVSVYETAEGLDEISVSIDGKEVSVSLYETPDLTEQDAKNIIEMFADEFSEYISEHNVFTLPSLRFVKETTHSGRLVMEAVVIDVDVDGFETAPSRRDSVSGQTEADFEDMTDLSESRQSVLLEDYEAVQVGAAVELVLEKERTMTSLESPTDINTVVSDGLKILEIPDHEDFRVIEPDDSSSPEMSFYSEGLETPVFGSLEELPHKMEEDWEMVDNRGISEEFNETINQFGGKINEFLNELNKLTGAEPDQINIFDSQELEPAQVIIEDIEEDTGIPQDGKDKRAQESQPKSERKDSMTQTINKKSAHERNKKPSETESNANQRQSPDVCDTDGFEIIQHSDIIDEALQTDTQGSKVATADLNSQSPDNQSDRDTPNKKKPLDTPQTGVTPDPSKSKEKDKIEEKVQKDESTIKIADNEIVGTPDLRKPEQEEKPANQHDISQDKPQDRPNSDNLLKQAPQPDLSKDTSVENVPQGSGDQQNQQVPIKSPETTESLKNQKDATTSNELPVSLETTGIPQVIQPEIGVEISEVTTTTQADAKSIVHTAVGIPGKDNLNVSFDDFTITEVTPLDTKILGTESKSEASEITLTKDTVSLSTTSESKSDSDRTLMEEHSVITTFQQNETKDEVMKAAEKTQSVTKDTTELSQADQVSVVEVLDGVKQIPGTPSEQAAASVQPTSDTIRTAASAETTLEVSQGSPVAQGQVSEEKVTAAQDGKIKLEQTLVSSVQQESSEILKIVTAEVLQRAATEVSQPQREAVSEKVTAQGLQQHTAEVLQKLTPQGLQKATVEILQQQPVEKLQQISAESLQQQTVQVLQNLTPDVLAKVTAEIVKQQPTLASQKATAPALQNQTALVLEKATTEILQQLTTQTKQLTGQNNQQESSKVLKQITTEILQKAASEVTQLQSAEGLQTVTAEGLQQNTAEVIKKLTPEILQKATLAVLQNQGVEVLQQISAEGIQQQTTQVLQNVTPELLQNVTSEVAIQQVPVSKKITVKDLQQKTAQVLEKITAQVLERSTADSVQQQTAEYLEQQAAKVLKHLSTAILQPTTSCALQAVASPQKGLQQHTAEVLENLSTEVLQQMTAEGLESTTAQVLQKVTTEVLQSVSATVLEQLTAQGVETKTSKNLQPKTVEALQKAAAEVLQKVAPQVLQTATAEVLKQQPAEVLQLIPTDLLQSKTAEITQQQENAAFVQSQTASIIRQLSVAILEPQNVKVLQEVSAPKEGIKQHTAHVLETFTTQVLQQLSVEGLQPKTAEVVQKVTAEILQTVTAEIVEKLMAEGVTAKTPKSLQPKTVETLQKVTAEVLEKVAPQVLHAAAAEVLKQQPTEDLQQITKEVQQSTLAETSFSKQKHTIQIQQQTTEYLQQQTANVLQQLSIAIMESQNTTILQNVAAPQEGLKQHATEVLQTLTTQVMQKLASAGLQPETIETLQKVTADVMQALSAEVVDQLTAQGVPTKTPKSLQPTTVEALQKTTIHVLQKVAPQLLQKATTEVLQQQLPEDLQKISKETEQPAVEQILTQQASDLLQHICTAVMESQNSIILQQVTAPQEGIKQHTAQVLETLTAQVLDNLRAEGLEPKTAEVLHKLATQVLQNVTTEVVDQLTTEGVPTKTSKTLQRKTVEALQKATVEVLQKVNSQVLQTATAEILKQSPAEDVQRIIEAVQQIADGQISQQQQTGEFLQQQTTIVLEQLANAIAQPETAAILKQVEAPQEGLKQHTAQVLETLTTQVLQQLTAEGLQPKTVDALQKVTAEVIQTVTAEVVDQLTAEGVSTKTPKSL
ncbi:unnamed protein product, partial [Allacma fusca]